jgi:hypothetical protein
MLAMTNREKRKREAEEEGKRETERETSTHIRIKKELYIYALTNLPRTTHTMAASQTYSIFHLFVFSVSVSFFFFSFFFSSFFSVVVADNLVKNTLS